MEKPKARIITGWRHVVEPRARAPRPAPPTQHEALHHARAALSRKP